MSALTPKADIDRQRLHDRFVLIATFLDLNTCGIACKILAEKPTTPKRRPPMTAHRKICVLILAFSLLSLSAAWSAESGLITKPSNHSVGEAVERFENAIKSKGWIVFTEIDHAVAVKQVGLDMKPRT